MTKAKIESKKDLEKVIADAQEKIKLIEENEKLLIRNEAIKSLSEYTGLEKINFFDKLYNKAYEELIDLEENNRDDDSVDNAWKAYIEILAKDKIKFWNYWKNRNI